MAEGWVRHLLSDRFEAFSAGIEPGRLDTRAVSVMAEAGVDISEQHSKDLSAVLEMPFDLVVTVCDHAQESCPVFPGRVRMIHRAFDDPPRLADGVSSEAEVLGIYRRVRDEIREFVAGLPHGLTTNGAVR